MTVMAMVHPRRYFSFSAVGAIAIRLPPTSSRMYTSSVSDPLANTSNTSSAASSVASGLAFIICSTAARERRVMRTPSNRGKGIRNASDRHGVGPLDAFTCRGTPARATHAAGEPFVGRPEVFWYLLDHPEFATHVTRTLRIARYRVWREPDGLWLDDGWGIVGRFSTVYAGNGARVMYARGRYKQWFLPAIHGRAVVVIEYGAAPAANGKSVINAAVTGFVKLDNPLVEMIGKLLSAAAAAKAENEAHQLVKVFARTTRAIENDPAGVHELLRQRPDVPRRELEEFRQLLRLP